MTERLYYNDSYLREFSAEVVEAADDKRTVYLSRTAFYPTSGGQPSDAGIIAGSRILEVVDEGERIAHRVAEPVTASVVECSIDWARRFDHMQQHSGQHLLSAVLAELFGLQTVGFHLSSNISVIDVAAPSIDNEKILRAEARANQIVFENRPLSIAFQESSDDLGLRKASDREGVLRVVSIDNLDRSACGGTHVRATGEIGPILIRKLDKAHGNTRIEFLCGQRAVRRARSDFDALSQVAKVLSSALGECPAMVAAQSEALQSAEKTRRRLAAELARYRGRELYDGAAPDASGLRRYVQRLAKGALDEELRATAQSFASGPKSLFLVTIEEPPSLLIAVSKDAGIHAGEALKSALAAVGGRGGGSALMAQAGLESKEALRHVSQALETLKSS